MAQGDRTGRRTGRVAVRSDPSIPREVRAMNEDLYDTNRTAVLSAIVSVNDRATVEVARNAAHDVTYQFNAAACRAVRELPEVTLESVLYLFGERP